MQAENTFELILNSKTFFIPSDFPYLKDINSKIITILLSKHQYEVKSKVNEDIFQSFINYLVKAEPPNIQEDNISEYDQLSQEFKIMKDLVKLVKKFLLNCSISTPTNDPPLESILDISAKSDKNEQIILNLFNIKGNNSEVQYKLLESCANPNFQFLGILSQIDIKEENGLLYVLFKNSKTASIFRNLSAKGNVTIPNSIEFESENYPVTSIIQSAFKNSIEIECIQFSEDSELRIIGKNAFKNSGIYEISIPFRVTQICEGAFSECKNLGEIQIPKNSELKILESKIFSNCLLEKFSIPSSIEKLHDDWFEDISYTQIEVIENETQNIKNFENIFIVGKSNLESNEYDVLLHANKDVYKFNIPSFIKRIAPYAFSENNIKKLEFSEPSQLQIIDKFSFFKCEISQISIPSSVKEIGDYAFFNCSELKKITFKNDSRLEIIGKSSIESDKLEFFWIPSNVKEINEDFFYSFPKSALISVMPNNKNFTFINENYLVGKSDQESDVFDVLLFAERDIETAKIPSFIKRIGSYAFNECFNLKEITFSDDSQLESIGKYAFFASGFKFISIPRTVKRIEDSAFAFCKAKRIDFPEDAELEEICNSAFFECSIRSLSIPSTVVELGEEWCKNVYKLRNISVMPGNKRYLYYNNSIVIGKSNLENENYDLLLFAPRSIEKVVIPSSIKHICPFAFNECTNLKEVVFENDSQLQLIDKYSFENCNIKRICIPESVTFINKFAFSLCSFLEKIDFGANSELRCVKKNAFANTRIECLSFPPHVHKIGKSAFARSKIIEINAELISLNLNAFNSPDAFLMVPANMKIFISANSNNH